MRKRELQKKIYFTIAFNGNESYNKNKNFPNEKCGNLINRKEVIL
jgi:hypothetical protein